MPTSFPAEAGSEPEVLDAEEQLRRDGYPSDGDEPEDPVDEKFFRSDRWKKYVAKNKLEHIQPQAPGQRGTRPAIQVKPLIAAAQQAGTSRQGVSRVSEAHGGYVRLPTAQDDETASVNDEELLRRWPTWKEGMAEAKEQLSLGLPVAANYLLTSLMQFISVAFVGHLGTLPLAASAVAYSLAEITGFSLMVSLRGALQCKKRQLQYYCQCNTTSVVQCSVLRKLSNHSLLTYTTLGTSPPSLCFPLSSLAGGSCECHGDYLRTGSRSRGPGDGRVGDSEGASHPHCHLRAGGVAVAESGAHTHCFWTGGRTSFEPCLDGTLRSAGQTTVACGLTCCLNSIAACSAFVTLSSAKTLRLLVILQECLCSLICLY